MIEQVDLATVETELKSVADTRKLDGSEAGPWSIGGVAAALVCTPSDPESLAEALAACDRTGAAVVPWGGGTQQGLGSPPERVDVALVTTKLDRLIEHEPGDMTVTAQAGMTLSQLQSTLGAHGQWLPLDPPLLSGATLGGALATDVSGPRRLKEGGLRDLVIGTRAANVDGKVSRAGGKVVKNVTGYDLNKLHVGSLGTLGILTEVSFKVAPLPPADRTWYCTFDDPQSAGLALSKLLWLPVSFAALDLVNAATAEEFGLSLEGAPWALLARATGFGPAVERQLSEFRTATRAREGADTITVDEQQAEGIWSDYLEKSAKRRWAEGWLTCRMALPSAEQGAVAAAVAGVGERPRIWGHGTGALFWSAAAEAAGRAEAVTRLREAVHKAGGRLIVENRGKDGIDLDVWGPEEPSYEYMRAIKRQYDPRGTLNPGRFVDGI